MLDYIKSTSDSIQIERTTLIVYDQGVEYRADCAPLLEKLVTSPEVVYVCYKYCVKIFQKVSMSIPIFIELDYQGHKIPLEKFSIGSFETLRRYPVPIINFSSPENLEASQKSAHRL